MQSEEEKGDETTSDNAENEDALEDKTDEVKKILNENTIDDNM